MDAYSDHMTRLSEARLSDLRREADRERLARSVLASRTSVWSRWRGRRPERSMAEVATLPVSVEPAAADLRQQRRSA